MANINLKNIIIKRSFGLLLSSIFIFLTVYCWLILNQSPITTSLFLTSVVLIFITFFVPKLLTPFHKSWLALGNALGYVMHSIILGCMFYLMITPSGILMRICGRDELRLNRRITSTYWINRVPPGPLPNSFYNQY